MKNYNKNILYCLKSDTLLKLCLHNNTSWEDAEASFTECQANLHRWGAANRVAFDQGKEEFIFLRRRDAIGKESRLFGINFNLKF